MQTTAGEQHLHTRRLTLRRQREADAVVFRQLWTERDPRVPPHRRIDADGHPTEAEIAAHIRASRDATGPELLTVVRHEPQDVIGYCGLVVTENGAPDEPELAFELLHAVHGHGFATEAAGAVLASAAEAGYERLWASVWDWNIASRRVLAKLGFRDTGRVVRESAHGRSLLTVREPSRRETATGDSPRLNRADIMCIIG
ncbi:GNAT family N-acetyltransferase [Microbacterium sp. G2-8]|uniref:GNAT family N-acetyltransferase n=1 Tax=Microbacterium sp. G2-8 TaxID=2842454 RepID=UPI001C8943A9|nr:GNAT family N-acetyltransferase [Microbacterium sp. G2-8]